WDRRLPADDPEGSGRLHHRRSFAASGCRRSRGRARPRTAGPARSRPVQRIRGLWGGGCCPAVQRRLANGRGGRRRRPCRVAGTSGVRSEEHTSELQSRENLVCRLLLEKKKKL